MLGIWSAKLEKIFTRLGRGVFLHVILSSYVIFGGAAEFSLLTQTKPHLWAVEQSLQEREWEKHVPVAS